MLENQDTVDTEQDSIPSENSSRGPKKQKRSRRNKRSLTMANVLTRFTSCGRCSMFLAAYRIDNDDQVLETAVENSDGEWLALPWDQALRLLVAKSYGCRLDADVYFFEGSCPECLGKFRYAEYDEQTLLMFKI